MKVIAFLRVSTAAQSIDSQSEQVRRAIIADGYDESDIIPIDAIESASKLTEEERSGLNRMKRYIETDHISSVYVYEISRIARREEVLYSIREYLHSHRVQLVCLTPPFRMFNDDWSISEQAAFTFSIFSTLASQETRIRKERTARGKARKKAEGKLAQGYPIFGYTVDRDHYIIHHPDQAPIVREIFNRYVSHESSGSIGKDLWLRGQLCCKTDKLISHQTKVCAILRERRYAYSDPIYRCPIITKELFEQAQSIRDSQPEHFVRKSRTIGCYPLQGYIRTEDGYVLTPSITNNRYVKMNGTTKALSLNMKAADKLSFEVMNRYLKSMNQILNLEEQRHNLQEDQHNTELKLKGIDSKIEVLQGERSRINRLYVKGRITEEESDKMMESNKDEIMTLEDLRQDLIYNLSILSNKLLLLANPLLLEDSSMECRTVEELKEAVHKYVKTINAVKLGFSKYRLTYHFLDGTVMSGTYFSTNKRLEIAID